MKSFVLLMIAALALGLAGCSAPARPMGDFHLGDTPDLVEAALGRPNDRQERTGTGGHETVWIYTHFHPQPPAATGWNEVLVAGVHDQNGTETQKPVTHAVSYKEVDRDMHVVFIDRRVRYVEYQTR